MIPTVVVFLFGSSLVLSACSRNAATSDTVDRPISADAAATTERQRHIDFSTVSLEHIAEHFAATSGRKITVAPEIARLKITGTMKIDGVDHFLVMLPRVLSVRVEVTPDGSVRILPKESRE